MTEQTPTETAERNDRWVRGPAAREILGRSRQSLSRLARDGRVRTHRPPGLAPLYFRPDLIKLAPPAA